MNGPYCYLHYQLPLLGKPIEATLSTRGQNCSPCTELLKNLTLLIVNCGKAKIQIAKFGLVSYLGFTILVPTPQNVYMYVIIGVWTRIVKIRCSGAKI